MLYFAYGSNLNKHQMHQRCPSYKLISVGYLSNYRYYYGGECEYWGGKAYANIIKSPHKKVWGVIYSVSRPDIKKLDQFEDVPRDYHRKIVKINTGKAIVHAYTYIGAKVKKGKPSLKYRKTTLSGAMADHLPKPYITKWI